MDKAQGRTAVARLLVRLWLHQSGTIVIKFAFVLPLLISGVAMAVDYGWLTSRQSQLQIAADAAALAGAKELSLSDTKRENVPAVVGAVVQAYAANSGGAGAKLKVAAEIVNDPLQVKVTVSAPVKAYFAQLPGLPDTLTVTSVARVLGKPNVCVLALDPSAAGAISLEKNAMVTGNACSVYSNSAHIYSIRSKDSATLKASFICARGGKDGWKGNFDPEPMTDCPGFEDPLSDRPEPSVGSCMENKLVINGGSATLNPGTYCGGLTIAKGANVSLRSGVYVMKDGALSVDGGSRIEGKGVGFYLTGLNAVLNLAADSVISLEAPSSGALTGLLFFESRSQPTYGKHSVLSNSAAKVIGTIYLSRGKLFVGGSSRMGHESAYTAIVARVLELTEGPSIVLNSNYDQTSVPVPKGIRGAGQPVALVK